MPTYEESVEFEVIAAQSAVEISQASLDLDVESAMSQNGTVNEITWNAGEKIYFHNGYTMSDGKLFGYNYLPDDIVIMEAIS